MTQRIRTRKVNGKVTVVCDECGADMVIRKNRRNGMEFLGCTRFPECTFTREVPIDMLMARAGEPMLPGFGELDDAIRVPNEN